MRCDVFDLSRKDFGFNGYIDGNGEMANAWVYDNEEDTGDFPPSQCDVLMGQGGNA